MSTVFQKKFRFFMECGEDRRHFIPAEPAMCPRVEARFQRENMAVMLPALHDGESILAFPRGPGYGSPLRKPRREP